ncbi:hypothetical protein K435DRAFT_871987 [Dendrothele bispora CBS 962.96]|uniref:Uncharacterized protein n=1 Tax=Dendrothele bispora (strain CBS 962.96) TaxID=1314807 RepID=A0A4S8L381_DENBC|nr:hypothetical protein K435DRAFT_871987 [Dendrothele bispora CBS 962.96]
MFRSSVNHPAGSVPHSAPSMTARPAGLPPSPFHPVPGSHQVHSPVPLCPKPVVLHTPSVGIQSRPSSHLPSLDMPLHLSRLSSPLHISSSSSLSRTSPVSLLHPSPISSSNPPRSLPIPTDVSRGFAKRFNSHIPSTVPSLSSPVPPIVPAVVPVLSRVPPVFTSPLLNLNSCSSPPAIPPVFPPTPFLRILLFPLLPQPLPFIVFLLHLHILLLLFSPL